MRRFVVVVLLLHALQGARPGTSFSIIVEPFRKRVVASKANNFPSFRRTRDNRDDNDYCTTTTTILHQSSYSSDSSEYSSDKSDFEDDGGNNVGGEYDRSSSSYREDDDDAPTIELQPVPMSKNSGNRFVAIMWNRELAPPDRDELDRHYDQIALTEDHVMFCRKANLYNETFNTESMVDVLRSLQILSSDLRRVIGQTLIMESTKLEYVQEVLSREPIAKMLAGGDHTKIPLYRWRHLRDYTLRIDDGRFGCPCMLLALDEDAEHVGNLREEVWEDFLEYLILSQRVIAAGPLHLPTQFKDDPSSMPVGDLILFNAKNREAAIEFVENMPSAQDGLYKSMQVHFYNSLDVTGKFISEDPLKDAPCAEMKEALEYWGYPVDDDQTPWLNW